MSDSETRHVTARLVGGDGTSDSETLHERAFLAPFSHAQAGDTPDAARMMLRAVADFLEGGEDLPSKVRKHYAAALRAIANDGANPGIALGVKTKMGVQPRTLSIKENKRIWGRLVARRVAAERLSTGVSINRACEIVAAEINVEGSQVRTYYYKYR